MNNSSSDLMRYCLWEKKKKKLILEIFFEHSFLLFIYLFHSLYFDYAWSVGDALRSSWSTYLFTLVNSFVLTLGHRSNGLTLLRVSISRLSRHLTMFFIVGRYIRKWKLNVIEHCFRTVGYDQSFDYANCRLEDDEIRRKSLCTS